MADADLGCWEPLPVGQVVAGFAGAPFRWWMAGGRALELHLRARLPHLDPRRRARLQGWLPDDHPWQRLLEPPG